MKKRLEEPNHLERLVEKFFIKNKHRVTFQLIPNTDYDKNKMEKLEKILSEKNRSLSSSQKDNIRDLTTKLEIRQNSKDDPSLLPCVTVNDIEKERFYTTGCKREDGAFPKSVLSRAFLRGEEELSSKMFSNKQASK